MNRSEISKRTWRARKRSGTKVMCPFCKKPVFAGGTMHQKRRYHKTCLRFSKAGLSRKQAGVSNPINRINPTSYKVAVKIAGEPGWSYNALRFATKEEADLFGRDLFSRWMLMEKYEVQSSNEPVDAAIVSGELKMLNPIPNPRPPAGWWADMMPRIRTQYPHRSPGSLRRILGGIWWNFPEVARKRIIRDYDKRNPILATLGTAALTGLGLGAGFAVASKTLKRRK